MASLLIYYRDGSNRDSLELDLECRDAGGWEKRMRGADSAFVQLRSLF
jgi:hypothetical protein